MILLVAALLPAIALMAYVYTRDKVEREPIGLVMRVFFLGALSGIVAALVEGVLIDAFEAVLPDGIVLLVAEYFIGVAAVEEACKFAALNTVKKHPEFNYVFDAVVYSVAAAVGFAALENVFYVLDPINGGLDTAIMRAILSVPGHAADGVVMGVFFGLARQRELHGNASGARSYYLLAWLLPVIEHGFYDAALSTESDFMALLAMAFDLIFVAIAFVLVKHSSANDAPLHPQIAAPSAQPAPSEAAQPAQPAQPARSSQPLQGVIPNRPMQPIPMPVPDQTPAPAQTPPNAAAPQAAPPGTWYCPFCGQPGIANFCSNCGTPRPQ